MPHPFRIRLLLAAGIVAIAGSVLAVGRLQASADDSSTHAIDAGRGMLIAMLNQETGLRGYINAHDPQFLDPYNQGRVQFEQDRGLALHYASDSIDEKNIAAMTAVARRWEALAESQLSDVEAGLHTTVADARARKAVMDQFRNANSEFITDKRADLAHDRRVVQWVGVAIVLALGLVFGVIGWAVFARPMERETSRRRRMAEFADALQVARSESEAFRVLRRHLEGWLEKARAVVLIRNASANRLQAVTSLDATPVLANRLEGATPESCLAVRLAKPYSRKPDDAGLLVCELCGELPACSMCSPTIVGGEVIGSVLVQTDEPIPQHETEDLAVSVSAAGPVIANLRNLAIAEMRAATDALTGLANHRAVQDTLNRMVAQAGRMKTQLACVMFDLDHFKQVNDIHGHAKGDEVLASIGAAVAATVRESDFVGRYGGEEFIALLPDTDLRGGEVLAEKLRVAISEVTIPEMEASLSASFGVAVLPGSALTGEQLVRAADRALYAAKRGGRNRVEVIGSGQSRTEAAETL